MLPIPTHDHIHINHRYLPRLQYSITTKKYLTTTNSTMGMSCADITTVLALVIVLIGYIGIAATDLTIGRVFEGELCERNLSVYLTVQGATTLLILLSPLPWMFPDCFRGWLVYLTLPICGLFNFAWLIYGTYLVSKVSFDTCHATLYRGSLASVIILWLLPLALPMVCCIWSASSWGEESSSKT